MEALITGQPLLVLDGIALIGVGVAIMLSSVARSRSQRPGNGIAQLFWRDVSQAGFIWAAATFALLLGSLVKIDAFQVPMWLFLAIIVGGVCLLIVRLRWVRLGLATGRTRADDPSRPDRPRMVSTTWEVALLGAAVGGLVVYLATVSHSWGHPIHWLVAGLAALMGYSVGLVAATPRYTIRRGSKASTPT